MPLTAAWRCTVSPCVRSHGPRYLCGSFNCIVHLHPAPLQLHTQLTWATLLTSLLFPGRRTPLTASSPRHRGPHRDCRGLRHLIQVGFEKRSSCCSNYSCIFSLYILFIIILFKYFLHNYFSKNLKKTCSSICCSMKNVFQSPPG